MNWFKRAQYGFKMPKRPLGSMDYQCGILSLGGQGSLETQGGEKNCIEIIRRAYDLGINYFDTSPVYGPSEDFYGEALNGIRSEVFLATKTHERDRDASLRLIEKSLKRLNTDYIDLWQIHHLEDIENVNLATADDGALQAMLEMQEQGVVKHLGITGHERIEPLLEIMKRHDFDSVLCPVNATDVHAKKPFIDSVVSEANKQKMAVIGMKVFSQGFLFHPEGITTPWEALSYSMSQPVSTVIVGIDTLGQLEEDVSIARSFVELDEEQRKRIEKLTGEKKNVRRGNFFRSEYGGYDSREKLDEPYGIQVEH